LTSSIRLDYISYIRFVYVHLYSTPHLEPYRRRIG